MLRPRRNASRADAARTAAAELREARSGVRKLEVELEQPVYKKVDEDEYAEIVKKQREEAGDWIVDDDGRGYVDIGEEEWGGGEPEPEKDSRARKGKGKAAEVDPNARARMERMFATAKARKQARPKRPAAGMDSTDDVLDAILSEHGLKGEPATVGRTPATAPHRAFPAPSRTPVASFTRAPTVATPRLSVGAVHTPAARLPAPSRPAPTHLRTPVTHGFAALSAATPSSAVRPAPPAADLDEAGPSTPGTTPRKAPRDAPAPRSPILALSSRDQVPVEVGTSPIRKRYRPSLAPSHDSGADALGGGAEAGAGSDRDVEMADMDIVADGAGEVTPTGAAAREAPRRAAVPLAEENDGPGPADWSTVWGVGGKSPLGAEAVAEEWKDDGSLPTVGANGALPFFLLDACEEPAQPGTVFLFGKIPAGGAGAEGSPGAAPPGFVSCCAVVRNLHRSVLVVPKSLGDAEEEVARLEKEAAEDSSRSKNLMAALHNALAPVKAEVRKLMTDRGIDKYTMCPVKRNYAFENPAVRHGEQWVLKLRYPASHGTLPVGLKGKTFAATFGGNQTMLEALTVKRRIMGSQWLFLTQPTRVTGSACQSWCKVEVTLSSAKHIDATSKELQNMRPPPLCVAALNLRTHVNPATHAHEVAAATIMVMTGVDVEGACADWRVRRKDGFVCVTRIDGTVLPAGLEEAARKEDVPLRSQPSERALLAFLLAKLHEMDVDAFVGHNISAFDLDILLHRLAKLKVPLWSRVGRLRRARAPSLSPSGGGAFGGGASHGVMQAVAGRIICDTYLAAREFHGKEVDYTLRTLARSLLGESRPDVDLSDLPRHYASARALLDVLRSSVIDCRLALGVAFHLNVLPLTRQIACLTGHPWARVLQGNRSHRIESLLLHKFHERKFMLPDKLTAKEREAEQGRKGGKGGKRGRGKGAGAQGAGVKDEPAEEGAMDGGDVEGESDGEREGGAGSGRARRKPAFSGGFVLEPKRGLYDKFILLMDFNSLYPSIIQEFNICFTTVARPAEGEAVSLPPSTDDPAPLPTVIRELVERRRHVKRLLKTERDPLTRHQLDVRQLALKITANSMYGCLGFTSARFYAKPLAELVTAQGREILQSTKDLVERSVGLEVVYGDTDSLMVYTGSEDLVAVRKVADEIKRLANKRYKLLELDLDGIFKRMLLLKKKKYAAVLVEQGPDGKLTERIEKKGLDIVRRDWCPMAKEAGERALAEILSDKPREEVVGAIHAMLAALRADLDANRVPLNKFVVTKQLTRRPQEYADAKNQPHVQVALRRIQKGRLGGTSQGETVPYVVCVGVDAETGAVKGDGKQPLAERAYHPEEVRESNGALAVDIDFYLAQQVHPVVSRLCTHIDGTDPAHLAHHLGLDASKFHARPAATPYSSDDVFLTAKSFLEDDATFERFPALTLSGPESGPFPFRGVAAVLRGEVAAADLLRPAKGAEGAAVAPVPACAIANAACACVRSVHRQFYKGLLVSEREEEVGQVARDVSLRPDEHGAVGAAPRGSDIRGPMLPALGERDVYLHFKHLQRQVDPHVAARLAFPKESHKEREDRVARAFSGPQGAAVLRALEQASAVARAAVEKCAYHHVQLGSLFARMGMR